MGVYSYRFSKVKIVSSILKRRAPACVSTLNVLYPHCSTQTTSEIANLWVDIIISQFFST